MPYTEGCSCFANEDCENPRTGSVLGPDTALMMMIMMIGHVEKRLPYLIFNTLFSENMVKWQYSYLNSRLCQCSIGTNTVGQVLLILLVVVPKLSGAA